MGWGGVGDDQSQNVCVVVWGAVERAAGRFRFAILSQSSFRQKFAKDRSGHVVPQGHLLDEGLRQRLPLWGGGGEARCEICILIQ